MKYYYRIQLAVAVLAISLGSTAWGGVNVGVNIGIPMPQIVISAPPFFIMPPSLGFYVAVDGPDDLYQVNNIYYIYRHDNWYKSPYYGGPWRAVRHNHLPYGLRRYNHQQLRAFRDEEYHHYRQNHDNYQGRHFRPNKMNYNHHGRLEKEAGRGKEKEKRSNDKHGGGRGNRK